MALLNEVTDTFTLKSVVATFLNRQSLWCLHTNCDRRNLEVCPRFQDDKKKCHGSAGTFSVCGWVKNINIMGFFDPEFLESVKLNFPFLHLVE